MGKAILLIALLYAASMAFGQTVVLFQGTGSSYADPSNPGSRLDTSIVPMAKSLADAYSTFKNVDRPILVGHSQGGSRALAYANYMAMRGQAAEGIISIGGPVRGFSPLKGGVGVFANRVKGVVDDVAEGFDAMVYALLSPFIGIFAGVPITRCAEPLIGAIVCMNKDQPAGDIVNMLIYGRVPINKNAELTISNELIADFTPGSAYQNTYLTPQAVDVPGYNVKVADGGHLEYIWTTTKILGIKVGFWVLTWVTDYKTAYVAPTYKDNPLLATSTKIAYVYGTNKSVAAFARDAGAGDKWDTAAPWIEAVAYLSDAAYALCTSYAIIDGAGAVVAACTLNIPLAVVLAAKAVTDGVKASDAATLAKLAHNPDYLLNERIYNTSASDGFVTVDSTSLPLSTTGGSSWTGVAGPNLYSINTSHNNLCKNEEIWGANGSINNNYAKDGAPIQPGGQIDRFLTAAGKSLRDRVIADKQQLRFD
jgi:hypothetical protein